MNFNVTSPQTSPARNTSSVTAPPRRTLPSGPVVPQLDSMPHSERVRSRVEQSQQTTQSLASLTSPSTVSQGNQTISQSQPEQVQQQHNSTPFAESELGQSIQSIGGQIESVGKVASALQDLQTAYQNPTEDNISQAAEGVDTLLEEAPKVFETAQQLGSLAAEYIPESVVSGASQLRERLPSMPSLPESVSSVASSVSETASSLLGATTETLSSYTPQMVTDVAAQVSPHLSTDGLVSASVGFYQSPGLLSGGNLVLVGLGGKDTSEAVQKTYAFCQEPNLENAAEALESVQSFVENDGLGKLCTVASVVQSVGSTVLPGTVQEYGGSALSTVGSYLPSVSTVSEYASSVSSVTSQYVPSVVTDVASNVCGYLPEATSILPIAGAVVNTGLALKAMHDLYQGTPDSSFKDTLKKTTSAVGSIADASGLLGVGTVAATSINLGIDVVAYTSDYTVSAGRTVLSWGSSAINYFWS